MGTASRQSFLNTLYSYIGVVVGGINVLVLYKSYFSPAQIGLISEMANLSMYALMLSLLGQNNVLLRYFPHYHTADGRHSGLVGWVVLVSFGSFVLTALLMLALRGTLVAAYEAEGQLVARYYYCIVLLAGAQWAFYLLEGFGMVLHRTTEALFFREVLLRLLTAGCVVVYGYGGLSFDGFVWLYIGLHLLQVLLQLWVVVVQLRFRLHIRLSHLRIPQAREFVRYGLYTFLSATSAVMMYRIDSSMVGWALGLGQEGVYFIYMSIAAVVFVPGKAFIRSAYPLITQFWKEEAMDKMEHLYSKTSLLGLLVSGWVMLGIVLNIPNMLSLLGHSEKNQLMQALWPILPWLAASQWLNAAFGVNGQILVTSRLYRLELVNNVLLLAVGIGLNYWLIGLWQAQGAAMATLLTMLLINVVRTTVLYRYFGLWPYGRRHVLIVGALLLQLAWLAVPQVHSLWVDLVVRSAGITLGFFGLVWWAGLAPELNAHLPSFLRRGAR